MKLNEMKFVLDCLFFFKYFWVNLLIFTFVNLYQRGMFLKQAQKLVMQRFIYQNINDQLLYLF